MNASPLVLDWATPLDLGLRDRDALIRSPITDDFVLVDGPVPASASGVVPDVLRAVEARAGRARRRAGGAYARLAKSSQLQLVQSEKMASFSGRWSRALVHDQHAASVTCATTWEMTRDALKRHCAAGRPRSRRWSTPRRASEVGNLDSRCISLPRSVMLGGHASMRRCRRTLDALLHSYALVDQHFNRK